MKRNRVLAVILAAVLLLGMAPAALATSDDNKCPLYSDGH